MLYINAPWYTTIRSVSWTNLPICQRQLNTGRFLFLFTFTLSIGRSKSHRLLQTESYSSLIRMYLNSCMVYTHNDGLNLNHSVKSSLMSLKVNIKHSKLKIKNSNLKPQITSNYMYEGGLRLSCWMPLDIIYSRYYCP